MKNAIKYGFGLYLGAALAKGVWAAVSEPYLRLVYKSDRVKAHIKKYYPYLYERTKEYR